MEQKRRRRSRKEKVTPQDNTEPIRWESSECDESSVNSLSVQILSSDKDYYEVAELMQAQESQKPLDENLKSQCDSSQHYSSASSSDTETAAADEHLQKESSEDAALQKESSEDAALQKYQLETASTTAILCRAVASSYPIEALLDPPGCFSRSRKIVIILRGIPGSGKTYVAKLIKVKELNNGRLPPVVLAANQFESKEDNENKDARENSAGMQRLLMFQNFKKIVDENISLLLIIDDVNSTINDFEELAEYGLHAGCKIFVAEIDNSDPMKCFKRCTSVGSFSHIIEILDGWETLPSSYTKLDVSVLLQEEHILDTKLYPIFRPSIIKRRQKELQNILRSSLFQRYLDEGEECVDIPLVTSAVSYTVWKMCVHNFIAKLKQVANKPTSCLASD